MPWQSESNAWLTTVRPDGAPQTSRVWFVVLDDAAWVSTGDTALKWRNLLADPRATIALDGRSAGVISGRATLHDSARSRPDVLAAFATKYNGWDAAADVPGWGNRVLISVPVGTFRPA